MTSQELNLGRHWRYISSFHGPWLQLPPEILETLANANYNTPRPRPIDPAVFFDLVKIRRLVDDATNLAVRAASGVASSALSNLGGASHHGGIGGGGGHAKLSRERKHRMREQATQKLAKAYRLDEIASSVATMQSTSTLEDVASLVLQRSPDDPDAKYVHFFHEKIPSRQLAESTSLVPLDEVITGRPNEAEPLRTRATVRVFKEDYERAAKDLTEALKLHRLYRAPHTAPKSYTQELKGHEVHPPPRGGRRNEDLIVLRDEDQPSSLEIQLLFQRAGVYLAIACQYVRLALPDPQSAAAGPAETQDGSGEQVETDSAPEPPAAGQETEQELLEAQKLARKIVKTNAKRALRDYMAYLSHFEYSPDLPIDIVEDFARKVNQTANGIRIPRNHSHTSRPQGTEAQTANGGRAPDTPYRVYSLSELLAANPPAGLPPYPRTDLAPPRQPNQPHSPTPAETSTETLTYHPLLADALHSLLLCHCLVQTSAKELLRHAYMVARLARLADGYPVFQASRSPARADWIEVLRRGENWIQLSGAWESLCAPAPLPLFQNSSTSGGPAPSPTLPTAPAKSPKALPAPGESRTESAAAGANGSGTNGVHKEPPPQKNDRQRHQAILDALGDDRVKDDITLRASILARQQRAEEEYRLNEAVAALDTKLMAQDLGPDSSSTAPKAPPTPTTPTLPASSDESANPTNTAATKAAPAGGAAGSTAPRRWAVDDGKEYPILTERAGAIARWVREAPPNAGSAEGEGGASGGRRRKKKPASKAGAGTGNAGAVADCPPAGSDAVEG